MRGEPLFSVVVPTHGRSALLQEALASVLAQSIGDFECIVVDDAGSPPVDIPDDARMRLFRRDHNGGAAAARNTGIAAARGVYVTFLDDDDVYLPRRLELAMEGLADNHIALCHRARLNGSSRTRESLNGYVHDVICDWFSPHLGQAAIRRAACPEFDERFRGCEDIEWWLRATDGLLVRTAQEVGYLQRSHAGNRHLSGEAARLAGSRLLLEAYGAYFNAHPKARAFRELRIGLLEQQAGSGVEARRAFRRSLRAHPTSQAAWRLAASYLKGVTPPGQRARAGLEIKGATWNAR